MFESLGKQSGEVVWVLTYLNADCKFSESVAQLRQALTNSLLGIEPQAGHVPAEEQHPPILAPDVNAPDLTLSPEARARQQEHENKQRFIAGVKEAVGKACGYLAQVRWSEQVRPRMGEVREEGEPFLVQKDEASQIIQMKQWVNALYHLEQGLQLIESDELTPHLKYYDETTSNVLLGLSFAWNFAKLNEYYDKIITSIHRSFHLITHTELDLKFIFEDELKIVSAFWEHWTSTPQSSSQTTDVLNSSEKIGFFLGLLLDQLRPNELGGVNYSLVTRAAAMLPELKRYFDKVPFSQQKIDLVALSKRFLGDFGIDDRGLIYDCVELIYNALESNLEQEEHLGELPALDDGPAKRFFKLLFTEQKKQEKNLDDLQETALKLKHALSDLHHGGILALINYIYIARHGWDLASVIQTESRELREEVQALVSEGVAYIRDVRLPKIIAFIDKLEEVFMFKPDSFAKPLMMKLNSTYRFLVFQLPVDNLGSMISSAFLLERFRLAELRHKKHVEQQQFATHVLKPAFRRLTAFSRFISTGVVGVANTGALTDEWSKLYRPLQQYLEALDPERSNYLLQCCRSGDWRFARSEDFFARFEERLLSLEQTHQLSIKLNVRVIQSTLLTLAKAHILRELQGFDTEGILFIPERFEHDIPQNKFEEYLRAAPSEDNLKLACQRRLDGYLITDLSEKAPVRSMAIKLKRLSNKIKEKLDLEASTKSSLKLLHIAEMLDYLEQSCAALELLCDQHSQWFFVAQTIVLFKAWVFASAVLPPYYLEAKETYQKEWRDTHDWLKRQTRYYDVNYHESKAMPVPDGMFYCMNALDIFPMHMKALHAKQDELSAKLVLATHKKAFEASTHFSKVMNASDSFMGLVFEYSAIWNLFSNAKAMGKAFLDKTYDILTQDGLNDLNERFFFSLLHKIDLYEIKFGLKPGVLSEKFEHVIGKFFRGVLEPLGLPSNNYIALISNRAPYDRRFRDLPAIAVTHQAYFRAKHSEVFFEQLATEGRMHCINRAMKHEIKRLNDTRTGLQHASNAMYLNAFEAFARPDIDAGVKGDAGIEEQVCEMLQIKMHEFEALHDQHYRRLDTILDALAELKKYLAVPADASLFETKETHRRKIRKVQQLEKIAQDINLVPGERIKKIRRVMQKDDFQATMLAYAKPDWFTYEAFKRSVLWLLECIGLYTPDCRTNYNNLVRSIHPDTQYTTSPLIKLGLFDTPVSSYERKEDKVVYKQLGITWCDDLEESLASSHEHP
jgi:hypothetical protein